MRTEDRLILSGGPLSCISALPPNHPFQEPHPPVTYDAIVIGGGVVGVSTAYALVRSGARTLMIDRRDPGRATDAGAGIITSGCDPTHPDPYYRFVGRAEAYYHDLIPQLEADGAEDTGYAVCGSLWVATDAREAAEFRRSTASAPEGDGRSGRAEVVTAERARELFPALDEVTGAFYSPNTARVDGRRLAAAVTDAAVSRGLTVREATVDAIVSDGREVRVRVDGDDIPAGDVVIAGGAWSEAFGDQLGVRIPVRPQRGQIVHLDVRDGDTGSWPILTGMGEHYMVPWPDDRVVVGATREAGAGFRAETTVDGILEVLHEAIRVAPGLRTAGIREIRVGLRPLSRDGLPVVGGVPGHAHVHVVTGHGPMGLHLGPYSGQAAADAIAAGAWAEDLARFGAERFQ